MASYLRNWFTLDTASAAAAPTDSVDDSDAPTVEVSSPHASDDEDSDGTIKDDDDTPPSFPAIGSAQRASSNSVPRVLTDTQLMPPPPLPGLANRQPGTSSLSSSLAVPSSAASSLAPPTTTTKKPGKKRAKVALTPGHSPLDWASLKSSGNDLRGVDTLMRIPPSVLKKHNTKEDAWSAFHGKVYNITPYILFHPGGEKELMRVAGRDGTKLFMTTHAWVNADFMLDACMVGFLVPEPSG